MSYNVEERARQRILAPYLEGKPLPTFGGSFGELSDEEMADVRRCDDEAMRRAEERNAADLARFQRIGVTVADGFASDLTAPEEQHDDRPVV